MSKPAVDIEHLTPEERLALLEQLWDSLSDEEVPLLTLGVLSLIANGGAGLLLSGAPDPRPLGADFASIALPGAKSLIQPMCTRSSWATPPD